MGNIGWEEYLKLFIERNEYIQRSYAKKYHDVSSQFDGRGVIYTAVTGGYDQIRDPEFVSDDFDYICFTDDTSFQSEVWDVRYIRNEDGLDNVRLARKYKCLGMDLLTEYDYSIWLDGKLRLKGNPKDLIEQYAGKSGLLAFPHYERDCIYDEALACLVVNKDNRDTIINQMKRYKQEGYPEHNGLIDSACLIRNHHDEKLKTVMRTWWNEILSGSYRDQLSFNYACYKHHFCYDICNLYLYNNSFIESKNHISKV